MVSGVSPLASTDELRWWSDRPGV